METTYKNYGNHKKTKTDYSSTQDWGEEKFQNTTEKMPQKPYQTTWPKPGYHDHTNVTHFGSKIYKFSQRLYQ